jgi:hypothetical protein
MSQATASSTKSLCSGSASNVVTWEKWTRLKEPAPAFR